MDLSTSSSRPRILCLHGGGTNATIFRRQARVLNRALSPYFRLVYANGPFICEPGPGVTNVYTAHAPFRRWLRWLPTQRPTEDEVAAAAIKKCVRGAMTADDKAGGCGPWVGLLGFSQGGKLAASLLFEAQEGRKDRDTDTCTSSDHGIDWKFGILVGSRAPLVSLDVKFLQPGLLDRPGELCPPPVPGERRRNIFRLRMPTVHVHGLRDPGLAFHRALRDDYMEHGSVELVEWHGGHAMPIKTDDVDRMVKAILKVAKKAGVDV